MRSAFLLLLLSGALFAGCATPFQGIRFRAHSPSIDEAFRKLTVALQADGYLLSQLDPSARQAETAWRPLKTTEDEKGERKGVSAGGECRMVFVLKERGRSFEVYWSPQMRTRKGEAWEVSTVDTSHPLWMKWHRALTQLLEKESREEE